MLMIIYWKKKKKSIIQTGTEPTFGKQGCWMARETMKVLLPTGWKRLVTVKLAWHGEFVQTFPPQRRLPGMSVQLFQSLRCAKKPQFYCLSSTLITFDSAGHAFHGRDEQVFEQFAGWNAATTKSWSLGSSRAREGAQQQHIGSNLPIHSAKAELWAGQKPLQVYFCTQRCTYLCEIAVIWRMRRKLSDGDGITSKLTRWLLDWPCLNIAKIHTLFSCKKIRIQVKRSLRWCASNKKDDQSQVKSEEVLPSCHV